MSYCDYPHAVKLATMGRLGATVGTATRGRVLRICIEEFPIRRTGPGMRGFREEKRIKREKLIRVTVFMNGKQYVEEKIIDSNISVKAKDIEIKDIGNNEIKINIKGVNINERNI